MQDDTVKVSRKQLLAACGLMRGKLPAGRYSFPKRDTPLLRVKPYQSPNSEVCYETEADFQVQTSVQTVIEIIFVK